VKSTKSTNQREVVKNLNISGACWSVLFPSDTRVHNLLLLQFMINFVFGNLVTVCFCVSSYDIHCFQ